MKIMALNITLMFAFLASMLAWFTVDVPNGLTLMLAFVLFYISRHRIIKSKISVQEHKAFSFYVLAVVINSFNVSMYSNITAIFGCLVVWMLFKSTDEFKVQLFKFINITLSASLAVSLAAYLLFLSGFTLPDYGTIDVIDQYLNKNYGFFLFGFYFPRFHAYFCEPGHLGMILSFMLFANKYDIKKVHVWIYIIVDLFTLSLSGYILSILGYVLTLLLKKQSRMFGWVLSVSIVLSLIYFGAISYNGGDNDINHNVIERLEFDEEKGIVGNNRFNEGLDQLYENTPLPQLIFGYGTEKFVQLSSDNDAGGAGYKMFFLINGMLVAILLLVFYYRTLLLSNNKKFALCFTILFISAFAQRAYPFWMSWILIMILSIPNYKIAYEYE